MTMAHGTNQMAMTMTKAKAYTTPGWQRESNTRKAQTSKEGTIIDIARTATTLRSL